MRDNIYASADVCDLLKHHMNKLFKCQLPSDYISYFSLYKLVSKVKTDNYIIYLFHCVWFFTEVLSFFSYG